MWYGTGIVLYRVIQHWQWHDLWFSFQFIIECYWLKPWLNIFPVFSFVLSLFSNKNLLKIRLNISSQYIQHKWIVLFARFDWFLNLGISSAIHLVRIKWFWTKATRFKVWKEARKFWPNPWDWPNPASKNLGLEATSVILVTTWMPFGKFILFINYFYLFSTPFMFIY